MVYVDDIIVLGRTDADLDRFVKLIRTYYKTNVLGPISRFVGIEFSWKQDGKVLLMHQTKYIHSLKTNFASTVDDRKIKVPLAPGTLVSIADCPNDSRVINDMKSKPYRRLLGSLLLLSQRTRPDIAFAISELAKVASNPAPKHWELLINTFHYVIHTQNYALKFEVKDHANMHIYSDADWGMDQDDRRSKTGYIVLFGSSPIAWKSSKQNSVATSTMEAELMAVSEATKEGIWLYRIIDEIFRMGNLQMPHFVLWSDSVNAIKFIQLPKENSRNKHIDIRRFFIREKLENNTFDIRYISTSQNPADFLTKPLSAPKIKHALENIGYTLQLETDGATLTNGGLC